MGPRTQTNRISVNQAVFLAQPAVLTTGKRLPSSQPPLPRDQKGIRDAIAFAFTE